MHSPGGEKIVFKRDIGNLKNMPYIDVHDVTKAFTSEVFALANIVAHQESRIQTIRKNMEGYSRKEVKRAIVARVAQSKVVHPPDSKFKLMVNSPSLKNCKVTVQDTTNSRAIFGPDLPGL